MEGESDEPRAGRGILGRATELDRWLHVVLVALVVTSAVRYAMRHPLDGFGVLVMLGAALFVAAYFARPLADRRPRGPTAWVAVVTGLWVALTLAAPSFAWTAVPVAFAALQVLAFPYAVGVVVLLTAVVGVAWSRITPELDPTVVVGPVGIALVTVMAYRALEREAATRQRLLDELTEAQADLAAAQRLSGALSERTRLSREIHDSVGQGLSSINLLLNAAEQSWDSRPDEARAHVRTAAETAREGLDEVRRVVRDLAPAQLDSDASGDALPAELRRVVAQAGPGLDLALHVHGAPVPVPPAVASALVRSARGALANVAEHAAATRAVVSLTYQPDEVRLDVRDDGRGFEPRHVRAPGVRGRGLNGIRQRAEELGGRATVESTPGEGTTVSIAFPLGGTHG